jgi:hypothetical protein
LKPSVIVHRWSEEHRAFAVETFFKNNGSARVGQNQLDDLNLVPRRHLCRWRSETHIAGYSGLKPSVIMHRWLEEHRAFAVETFFKNNGSTTVTQRVFRRHFDTGGMERFRHAKQY